MNIEVYNYLTTSDLKDGIDTLYKDAKKLYDWELLSRLEALRTNYRYMLQYISDGVEDPGASEMYQKLLREAFDCMDRYDFLSNTQKYPQLYNSYYSRQSRNLKDYCQSLQEQAQSMREAGLFNVDPYDCSEEVVKQFARYVELIDNIFNIIYLSPAWTEDERDMVLSLFKAGLVDVCALDVIVSAVNICLLQHFDMLKYDFLVDVYLSVNYQSTRIKALIGFYLSVCMQGERFMSLKEMWNPVNKLTENEDDGYTADIIPFIHVQYWLTEYTQKYEKELNTEVLPSMMEAQNKYPQYLERMLKGLSGVDDMDQDAKKVLKKAEKMRKKLIANHEQGVDTYFVYFKQLKNFRFFMKPSHWFYPYRTHLCPDLMKLFTESKPDKKSVFHMILTSDSLCESDKYSLALEAILLPPTQRNILFNHFDFNIFVQGMPNLFIWDGKPADKYSIVAHYFQDLYRFFALCPNAKFMEKPSSVEIPFHGDPFYECFSYEDVMKIADVCKFTKEHGRAGMIYNQLSKDKEHSNNIELWKKAVLNEEKKELSDYGNILRYLDKALEIDPNDEWCLKRKIKIFSDTGRYSELEKAWSVMYKLHPEDLSTLCSLAEAQIGGQKLDEALKHLFMADYLSDYNARVKRDIGWCYLRKRDYDKAKLYFKTVIKEEEKPDKRDWLNLGHAYNFLKQRRNAVRCYRKSLELFGDYKKFKDDFEEDMEVYLWETNRDDIDMLFNRLVLDAIREIKE